MKRSLLFLALASPVAAQVRDTAKLESVVVTATRTPLAIGDIPASVTVLSGADLRARGIVSVSDALREVPGVTVARSGSFGGVTSLFVRGGQSNYTKVMIDGVPVNEAGGFFDWALLTTDNVERIEIVRGPSSVVWGSDAVTGVVNIITRSGRNAHRATLEARAGSFNSRDAEAQLSHSAMSTSYSLGIGHHATDGIYSFNNQNAETVLSGRADAALDEKTSASFSVRYQDFNNHYPTDGTGAAVDSNQYDFSDLLAFGAKFRRLLNSTWSIQASAASSGQDGGTNDAAGQGGTDSFLSSDHKTRRSGELRATANLATGMLLTLGGQIEEQGLRSLQEFGGAFSSASAFRAVRRDRSAFGELVSTTSRLTATAGARVDDNQQFGSFGTFRVGAQYAIAGATTVRASAGTAFREPSLDQNFATGFVTGNPDLKPEHTTSWEVGLATTVGDASRNGDAHLSLTWFDQRFVDLIDYNGGAAAGKPNYENIAKANASGAEVELTTHPPIHGILGVFTLTKLKTEVVERGFSTATTASLVQGQRLLRRPDWSGSARVGYTGIDRLSVDAVATYVGSRDDRQFLNSPPFVQAVALPAYTLFDLSAAYRLEAPGNPSIMARVANLSDVQYQSVAGYRSPGRTISAGLKLEY
ncbi:MAG TPA: TonB-dependent receptor [Gemmatimonadaceae bacterium]